MERATDPVLETSGVSKSFGSVRAVSNLSLGVAPGERLGIVGHNGAGKSTLMNMLVGVLSPDSGAFKVAGQDVAAGYSAAQAFSLGVRCVFQELSLCSNLTIAENLRLQHRSLHGRSWRSRAAALIRSSLDRIFPGHGIDGDARTEDLSIGQRQMVEIARAFTVVDDPLRLVVLDEPTSSLDARTTASLLAFVRQAAEEGVATIFISHRLDEVLSVVDRVVVMRDGAIAAELATAKLTKNALVAHMTGGLETHPRVKAPSRAGERPVRVAVSGAAHLPYSLTLRAGEIVGLGGLDGHGQRRLLHRLFFRQAAAGEKAEVRGSLAYVSGDRNREGVFPLWSVQRNISIGSLPLLRKLGALPPGREKNFAERWRSIMGIRVPNVGHPIKGLSGGNQQKVLLARVLASNAEVILLDDPTRGVDIATKNEVYEFVGREADKGRAFLWYATELEELEICDRCYVFYENRIVDEVPSAEFNEERMLRSSFAGG